VPGISAQHNRIFSLRMRHKDGAPVLAEQNRAAPPVRNPDFAKRRMKFVNPPLDGLEQISCTSFGDIDVFQIAGIVRVHEPGARSGFRRGGSGPTDMANRPCRRGFARQGR
jgi:hypothetical protein